MIKRWITQFAEWWLDVEHQNLLTVAVGAMPQGRFIPVLMKDVPMVLKDSVLRPRVSPIVFTPHYAVTLTHYARLDCDGLWASKPLAHPSNLICGDTLRLTLKLDVS